MIRLLSAFIWLRWRLLANGVKGGHRRDAVERLSRVLALMAPAAVLILFLLGSLVMAGLGSAAGFALAGGEPGSARPEVTRGVLAAVRLLLLAVTAVLILVPLGRSLQAGLPGSARLLLLPIPRRLMHFVDVAAGLFDPWLLFLVPGLVLLGVSLAVAGRPLAGALALAAGGALLAVLACLSGLATFLMQWLMRDRRRAEAAAILLTAVLASAGMIPAFLVEKGEKGDGDMRIAIPRAAWALPFPGELYGWTLGQAVEDRPAAGLTGIAGLIAEAALLFWVSSKVHARILTGTASSGPRRDGLSGVRDDRKLPLLSPAASSVARTQFSTALRTVRGRMGVYLNAPVLLMLGLMMHRFAALDVGGPFSFSADGTSLFGMGVLLSLLSLQPILMNQFASDRAGLTLQLLAPVSDTDLLAGKAAGCMGLVGASGLLCLIVSLVAAPPAPAVLWGAAIACGLATTALIIPVAALLSLLFPRRADLSRMGSGGNAHAAATLLGSLATFAAALPGSLILMAGSWLEMTWIAAAAALVWLALTAGVAGAALIVLGPLLRARRENLLLVAAGG